MSRKIPGAVALAFMAPLPYPLHSQAGPTTAADIRYYCEDVPPSNNLARYGISR